MYLFPFITPRQLLFNTSVKSGSSYQINELEDQYQIKMDALGRNLSDIDVNVVGQRLSIELPSSDLVPNQEDLTRTVWQELDLGAHSYTFNLGHQIDLDRIEAELKQGQLLITLHKKAIETQKIAVQIK